MIIQITANEKQRCLEFARKIVLGGNQYARLGANDKKRVQRTYAGKVAEYAFLKYIRANGKPNYPEGDMFKIFKGQNNVDSYDFIDDDGETFDIKAAFLPNHKNIMIPESQLQRMPKDQYVAIKLNGKFEEPDGDLQLVDVESITQAEIIGQVDFNSIDLLPTKNFTKDKKIEANCKGVSLMKFKTINFK